MRALSLGRDWQCVKATAERGTNIYNVTWYMPVPKQSTAMVRAIWSPKMCLLERRVNCRQLLDRRYGLHERAVTYDGPDIFSTACEFLSQHLPTTDTKHLPSELGVHLLMVRSGHMPALLTLRRTIWRASAGALARTFSPVVLDDDTTENVCRRSRVFCSSSSRKCVTFTGAEVLREHCSACE